MSTGSIADGFVEIQLKTDQMAAQSRQVIAETAKIAKAAETAWNTTQNKIATQQKNALKMQKEIFRLQGAGGTPYTGGARNTIGGGSFLDETGLAAKIASSVRTGMTLASGVGAAGAGLAFAGAAAAGSTTFDTLTGSLKMLSLAAGAKAQAPVLKLASIIQSLAKSAENAPNGVVGGIGGGLSGGLLGLKMGGPIGGLIGAALGGLAGGGVEKGVNDFADKRNMVEKLKADPNYVGKLLKEIQDLEKDPFANVPFIGNQTEIAKRRGAIRTFEARKEMAKDELKTAGLGFPGAFHGLTDLRQQAQQAIFSGSGDLGQKNMVAELKLNTDAVNANTREQKNTKQSSNPNFVGPPAP